MSYKTLHNSIIEAVTERDPRRQALREKSRLEEKPADNDKDEDYDAEHAEEKNPHSTAGTDDTKNKKSVKTKGNNDSIAEAKENGGKDQKKKPEKSKDKVEINPDEPAKDNITSEQKINEGKRVVVSTDDVTNVSALVDAFYKAGHDPRRLKGGKIELDVKAADPRKAVALIKQDHRKMYGEEVINERELTDAEEQKKEEYVKELKKKKDEFEEKYGDKAMDVIYATATKMAKKNSEKSESVQVTEEDKEKYNKVFRAVAKHMDLDPENIDQEDKDTKKKFFDTVDKCWDPEEDKVPDGCPIDIDLGEAANPKGYTPARGKAAKNSSGDQPGLDKDHRADYAKRPSGKSDDEAHGLSRGFSGSKGPKPSDAQRKKTREKQLAALKKKGFLK